MTTDHQVPPPRNHEAEEMLLGALIAAPGNVADALVAVSGEDFYDEAHRDIFSAIVGLDASGTPVEPLTVIDWLAKGGQLERAGGRDRVLDLMERAFTAASYRTYAGLVREAATLRRLLRVGQDIETMVGQRQADTDDLLVRAEDLVYGLMQRQVRGGLVHARQMADRTIQNLTEAFERGASISGLPSGFIDLDQMIGGMRNGNLLIVAARPSMGKTAFALAIAQHVALREDKTVAIFSLEMSGDDLISRMVSSEGMVDSKRMHSGQLSAGDWPRVTQVADRLSRAQLYIDESAGMTVAEMRTKAKRLKSREGLDLVIVDYLQLMEGDSRRGRDDNRVNEISAISRGLKLLARDLDVPVVCLSQLNRSAESRPDKKPLLSDLRESGAIEQDADLVMLIFREDYYNPENNENRGKAEINIAKNRNGPTGRFTLNFESTYARFSNAVKGI